MDLKNYQTPQPDEFQLLLFGPGYGESILIHIGSNKWIIIDSCIFENGEPAPIKFLQDAGIDPSTAVTLIIATHWHDDHIRGMSKIVETCTSATFCCSMSLSKEEFINNVTKIESETPIVGGSGGREITKILELLEFRSPPKRVISGTRIKSFSASDFSHGKEAEVWALSPSDKQIDIFLNKIAELCTDIDKTRFRISSEGKNDTSVVLWISIGDLKILLGADLEETADHETGWSVAISSEGRKTEDQANIFKIPHHGSITGHSDDVWNQMIQNDAISITTPFNRGKKLPSKTDIDRILTFSDAAYLTKCSPDLKPIKRHLTVEKTIKETVGKLRRINNSPGTILIRCNITNFKLESPNIQIILGSDACHLAPIH